MPCVVFGARQVLAMAIRAKDTLVGGSVSRLVRYYKINRRLSLRESRQRNYADRPDQWSFRAIYPGGALAFAIEKGARWARVVALWLSQLRKSKARLTPF